MAKPTKRVIYTIRWEKSTKRWVCREYPTSARTKGGIVRLMARIARGKWEAAGTLSQLRIFGKGGRIQSERTYGKDPRRFPG